MAAGDWGCALSVRIFSEALDRLTPRAAVCYCTTGAPIVDGV